MSNNFFYEDGQENIADEQGNDAMDYEEEVAPFNASPLMAASRHRLIQERFPTESTEELDTQMEDISEGLVAESATGRKYNVCSDKQKAIFYYFNRIKLLNAAASARKAQVEVLTVQKWAKRLKVLSS